MHRYSRGVSFGMVSCAALWFFCGCTGGGEKGIKVRGKLLKGGQPAQVDITGKQLPPGDSGRMKVMLYPVKSDDQKLLDGYGNLTVVGGEQAGVEADGTFVVSRPKEMGIPPGKYRFVITHTDPFTNQDLLKGKFSEANSKITREVTSSDQEIVIDLDKPTG